MADGALNLTLDDYASAKLAEKAKALDMSPEQLAILLLGQQLFDHEDFTWMNGDPRKPLPPFDQNEPTYELEEVLAEFSAELDRRLAAKA
ncbi:MAG: hypothetical protein KJ676_13700 [Alphaproteobacteria bacterium]|nr:hypothetical protein [Alphaproteobacteria bacterium]MBU1525826.1 hypothetical protein [Alphaproteobacteria bacterium]MBU2118318.1 hypothetical protein [Alphaproteobacteria bacterium]MBU2350043.1 hypothetical protein [Alphaproteobacteria bacterium]MBU2383212.1 hypothetical protein [Alphaproteobacteria bacterium]